MLEGYVVKLDRGFPLVRAEDGNEYRGEHAIALVKERSKRAVIGDKVLIDIPEGHDKAIIEEILPRRNQLVRKDPTEQALPQVLAANFDLILIAQPITDINLRRLEREMVLAYETGAEVRVILTKADLLENGKELDEQAGMVADLVGADKMVVISAEDEQSIEVVRAMIPEGTTAVLIGKSGVGKSSLINLLVGSELLKTATVREGDGKGRHTTVSREVVNIPNGGRIIDMPGVRGLGLWDAEAGIEAAFAEIEERAMHCRFRDCKHENEPGCAVREAIERGEIAAPRLKSYQTLKQETEEVLERREEASRLRSRTGRARKQSVRKKK